MKSFVMITLVVITILQFSCGNSRSDKELVGNAPIGTVQSELKADYEPEYLSDSTAPQVPDEKKQEQQPKEEQLPPAKPDWDKKIIKNANLTLEVKDFKAFNNSLRQKIRDHGGYIAQEEQNQSEYKIENTVVLKVPVDQFDLAITSISNDVQNVIVKRITSQDVTAEYVDTRSRMEAKKQVRQRYIDLLKQAKNMEEILHVQQQVNGIQEEIESAAGRIQYLGHSATFSTIHLTFFQVLNSSAKEAENPSFGNKLAQAFKMGGSWIADLFVGLVTIWPLFLILFVAWILFRRFRNQQVKSEK